MAIVGMSTGNGTWQYSRNNGTSWSAIPNVSETNALLLGQTDRVRFVPNGISGSTEFLDIRAWDETSGLSGLTVDTTTNGGSTAFSTAIERVDLIVTNVNDAPVLDTAGALTLTTIAEDTLGHPGDTVADIIASDGGDRITDVDDNAVEGIIVYAADTTNGTWQYSIDNGGSWSDLGSVTTSAARMLDANARVRFTPNQDYNGNAYITFKAWDQTAGTNGGTAQLTDGGTTSQSTAFESALISVTPVNDAPTVTPQSMTVNENSLFNVIASLGTTDVDDSGTGLSYIITGDVSSGGLLLSTPGGGTSVLGVGDLFTQDDIDAGRLSYSQDGSELPTDSFSFTVEDGGENGATPASGSFTVNINNVNDAPVLDNTGSMSLDDINEDDTNSAGARVSDIISSATGNRITDFDVNSVEGIALIAADTTNGTWQFRAQPGSSWANVGAVSTSNALLLRSNSALRFVPNPDYSGPSGEIEFHAWDQTTVEGAGDNVNIGVTGGTSAFSSATEIASLFVEDVNDAPVLTSGVIEDLTVGEDSGLTSLGLGSLTYGPGGGSDENIQTLTYTVTTVPAANLGEIVLADGTTVVTSSTAYSLAQLQGMQFRTAANANGGPTTFAFTVVDDGTTNGTSDPLMLTESLDITVSPANDDPTVESPIGSVTVDEDSADTTIDLTTVFGDLDIATNSDSLTVSVISNGNPTLVDATITGNTLTLDYQADQNGTSSIVIRATDLAGQFVEDTVDLTVNPVNDDPTVDSAIGSITVDEDSADTTIDLSTVFGDVDIATNSDSLTFSVISNGNPTLVDATITGNTLTLDYQPNQNGTSTIVIRATDLAGEFVEDTVNLTVNPANDTPTVDSPIGSVTVDEDSADTTIDLSAVFDDVDIATNSDSLTFSVISNGSPALVDASIIGNTLTLDYQPNQNGTSSIVIRATDLAGQFVEDTVALTVNPVADAPTVASPVGTVMVDEDSADTVIDLSAVFDDVDIATNSDSLSFTLISNDDQSL